MRRPRPVSTGDLDRLGWRRPCQPGWPASRDALEDWLAGPQSTDRDKGPGHRTAPGGFGLPAPDRLPSRSSWGFQSEKELGGGSGAPSRRTAEASPHLGRHAPGAREIGVDAGSPELCFPDLRSNPRQSPSSGSPCRYLPVSPKDLPRYLRERHDHCTEQIGHQGVRWGDSANRFRRQIGVRDLKCHSDRKRQVSKVEVGRRVLLVEINSAFRILIMRPGVSQREYRVDGRPRQDDADNADGDEIGLRAAETALP